MKGSKANIIYLYYYNDNYDDNDNNDIIINDDYTYDDKLKKQSFLNLTLAR